MKLNNTDYPDWNSATNNDGNSSGFSALPAGNREFAGGFYYRGSSANFWEATEDRASRAVNRHLSFESPYLDEYRFQFYKHLGYSVRCAKD